MKPSMHALVEAFPHHVLDALDRGSAFVQTGTRPDREIREVIFTGMGGSGMGATLAVEWASAALRLPVSVSKRYTLPAHVGPHTAVVAMSYSGDTEETLAAVAQARSAGAWILAVGSGGALQQQARAHNENFWSMDPGNPPRSMVAFGLVYALFALEFCGAGAVDSWQSGLRNAATALGKRSGEIRSRAAQLAPVLAGKITAFYATTGTGAIATRWRQQWNENAKLPGWDAEIPEMNHNETVGWAGGSDAVAAVFLRHPEDGLRNRFRLEFTAHRLRDAGGTVVEILPKATDPWEAGLELIHLGDWLSVEAADRSGADILDIQIIQDLKAQLHQWKAPENGSISPI
jgi:glucose/mannose-6-phosphate isomerase